MTDERRRGLPSLRAGAIDVGSNAIRSLVADAAREGGFRKVESDRASVRLGVTDAGEARSLSSAAMDAAVEAIARMRERFDELGVVRRRAVATSAVRESSNGEEFAARVREEAGIELEVISGEEEARLGWRAVNARVDLGEERWLTMDLGGGSLELSVVDREGILWTESRAMGAVRLLAELSTEDDAPLPARFRARLDEQLRAFDLERVVAEWRPAGVVASGGNIDAIADVMEAPSDRLGVSLLRLRALHRAIDLLAGLTVQERIERYRLRPDRADVILPAAVVYARVAELAGATELLVPRVGVREGIVLSLLGE